MKLALAFSLVLFIAACCAPALEFKRSTGATEVMWGGAVLAVGWSGIFAAVVAWYANPIWLVALIFGAFRKVGAAGIAGVIAFLLACSTFAVIGRELPGDEGGVTRIVLIRLLPGCYLWIASLLVIPIAAVVSKMR